MYIFLKEDIDYFEFNDLSTKVYGFAFNHSHIYERKLANLKRYDMDDSFINIGLFHGQIDHK